MTNGTPRTPDAEANGETIDDVIEAVLVRYVAQCEQAVSPYKTGPPAAGRSQNTMRSGSVMLLRRPSWLLERSGIGRQYRDQVGLLTHLIPLKNELAGVDLIPAGVKSRDGIADDPDSDRPDVGHGAQFGIAGRR